jgi:hypothetical protein
MKQITDDGAGEGESKRVVAARVKLSRRLPAGNLLLPGTATTARKAPTPDRLYVVVRKCLRFGIPRTLASPVSHTATARDREKALSLQCHGKSRFYHFLGITTYSPGTCERPSSATSPRMREGSPDHAMPTSRYPSRPGSRMAFGELTTDLRSRHWNLGTTNLCQVHFRIALWHIADTAWGQHQPFV